MVNWKLRLKNPATAIPLIILTISFLYQVLDLLGIVPKITQDSVMNVLTIIVQLLATLGIITDPTTKGVGDSQRALTYEKPKEE